MNFWDTVTVLGPVQGFALALAISGVVVSSLALAADRLLRRRSPALRYRVLFGGILVGLAGPALVGVGRSLAPIFAGAAEQTVRIPAEHALEWLGRPAPVPRQPPAEAAAAGRVIGGVPVAVWAVGTLLGLFGVVRGLRRQRYALVGWVWRSAWWTDERRRDLAAKVGLRAFPPVWQSPLTPMPMVVGLWRPRIVLPEATPSAWGRPEWEAVLLHEAAHVARRDPLAALAQRLAVALFWWCVPVHRLSRRLNELRETICDDYALSACDRLAYAAVLVEAAERLVGLRTAPVPVGLLDSARGGLEERVTRLLEKEEQTMVKLPLVGRLLSASAVALACLGITAAAYSQAPPPQQKIQIKILIDGKEVDLTDEVVRALLAAKKQEPAPPVRSAGKSKRGSRELTPQEADEWKKWADDWKKWAEEWKKVRPQGDPFVNPEDWKKWADQWKKQMGKLGQPPVGQFANPKDWKKWADQWKKWQPPAGKSVKPEEWKKWADEWKRQVEKQVRPPFGRFETPDEWKKWADEWKKWGEEWQPRPLRAGKPVAPAPPAAELEAIQQELRRLTAEVEALRKKIQAQKK
jgi:beta-lactamase regulating signal transducer with metallopeptidase domain